MGVRNWPEPDFLPGKPRAPAMAWLWVAAGAISLAVAAGDVGDLRERIEQAQYRVARSQHALEASAARPGRGTPGPVSVAAPGRALRNTTPFDDVKAMARAARLEQRIDHPWNRLLPSIEAATPADIQWLSMEHDVDRPEIRLEGVATDVHVALGFVAALSAQGVWSNVALAEVRHAGAADAVASGLVFDVAACIAPIAASAVEGGR